MRLQILTPIKAYVKDATPEEMDKLAILLTYTNTSAQHLLKRHMDNHWFRSKNTVAWELRLDELKKNVKKTLIYDDSYGTYIRPGSIPYIEQHFDLTVENEVKYPTFKKIPWAKPLPFTLYPYQEQSVESLMSIKHGNVEIATGGGKSSVITKICRESGLNVVVVVPSKSIFEELSLTLENHLGKGNIGKFGAGKKKIGKRITICIGDSLVNVKPSSPEWEFFNNQDAVIIDESHVLGADTLEQVCHNVLANIPYRFFLSGTQTRGDGAKKLLESIIGKTVHTLSTADAVKGGYICPHEYRIVEIESSDPNFYVSDPLEMKRQHFLRNYNIAKFTAQLANISGMEGKQTLVLVDELSQIAALVPLLKVPVAYAHSDANKDKLKEMGLEKVNTAESIEKFNKNEVKVLIGTSCISTGTNIYPTHQVVNWVGGSSVIRTKQGAVGRSVRLGKANPWAEKCLPKDKAIIWDFDVEDNFVLNKHLEDRIECYKDSNSPIKWVKLK